MARPGKEKAIAPASMEMGELLRKRDAVSLSSLSFVMHLCSFHLFSTSIYPIPILSLFLPFAGAGTICVSAPRAAFHPKTSLPHSHRAGFQALKLPAFAFAYQSQPPCSRLLCCRRHERHGTTATEVSVVTNNHLFRVLSLT